MDLVTVVLRLLHIVLGALWVGMMAFNVFFLGPALQDAGPAGGAVMAALQRRRLMTVMPAIALVTILSGLWLMMRVWGGVGPLMDSTAGQTLALGATAAIVAFVLGVGILRPIMVRTTALAQGMGTARSDQERAERVTELEGLRARGTVLSRLIMALLLLAVATMAIAQYLV
ncbi:MAG TPA: hypothetical protein VFH97_10225 [Gemmatimonadales bacterium]|nr:hypothetical protein [Gemmatimonadales bacterium]